MPIKLPAPIARYLDAANTDDADAVAACFTADARVQDEARDHDGAAAIRAWAAAARRRYRFHAEPRSFEPAFDGGTVTAHLTGDFPGAPADLRYRFRLAGDRVADLEITLRDPRAELTGRRGLVTGGGQGIGAAVVRRLLAVPRMGRSPASSYRTGTATKHQGCAWAGAGAFRPPPRAVYSVTRLVAWASWVATRVWRATYKVRWAIRTFR